MAGEDDKGTGTETATETNEAHEWMSGLPDTLQENPVLRRFKTLDSFANSFLESRQKYRNGAVVVPDKDSSDEQREAYRQHMGIPADADGYELPDAPLPEKASPDQLPDANAGERQKGIRKLASDLGLTQAQAKKLANWLHQDDSSNVTTKADTIRTHDATVAAALQESYGDELQGLLNGLPQLYPLILPEEEGKPARLQPFFDQEYHPGGVARSQVFREIMINMLKLTKPDRFVNGNDKPSSRGSGDPQSAMLDYSGGVGPVGVRFPGQS